jgi:hypothetical protein
MKAWSDIEGRACFYNLLEHGLCVDDDDDDATVFERYILSEESSFVAAAPKQLPTWPRRPDS